jgi:hypothetical protein
MIFCMTLGTASLALAKTLNKREFATAGAGHDVAMALAAAGTARRCAMPPNADRKFEVTASVLIAVTVHRVCFTADAASQYPFASEFTQFVTLGVILKELLEFYFQIRQI